MRSMQLMIDDATRNYLSANRIDTSLSGINLYLFAIEEAHGFLKDWISKLINEREIVHTKKVKSAKRIQEFNLGCVITKLICALETSKTPDEVQISRTSRGKPFVDDRAWQFNLSHCKTHLAIATSYKNSVGVDIDSWPAGKEAGHLVNKIATPREKDSYLQLPLSQRSDWFNRLWVVKESTLKMLGEGFYNCPKKIEMGEPSLLCSLHGKSMVYHYESDQHASEKPPCRYDVELVPVTLGDAQGYTAITSGVGQ